MHLYIVAVSFSEAFPSLFFDKGDIAFFKPLQHNLPGGLTLLPVMWSCSFVLCTNFNIMPDLIQT